MRNLIFVLLAFLTLSCDNEDGITIYDTTDNGVVDESITLFTASGTGTPESYFNQISEIFVDSKERVWLAIERDDNTRSGFILYENGTSTRFDTQEITDDDGFGGEVYQFAEDANGKIWIADGGGLCYYDEVSKEVKTHESSFGSTGTHSVRLLDGKIYCGTYNGKVGIIDQSGNIEELEIDSETGSGSIKDIEIDKNGNLVLCGTFTITIYDGENFKHYSTDDILGDDAPFTIHMNSIAKDSNGNLLIGDRDRRNDTFLWDGEKISLGNDFNETGITNAVRRHYYHDGDYWVASDGFGITQARNGSVVKIWDYQNSQIPGNYIYSLSFSNDKVYFSSQFNNTGAWGYIEL
jgi:hypothetical protein